MQPEAVHVIDAHISVIIAPLHRPPPSQYVRVKFVPSHDVAHCVLPSRYAQVPPAAQRPLVPQTDVSRPAQYGVGSGAPAFTTWQVPSIVGNAQVWHDGHELVVQQTPSVQWVIDPM